MYIGWPDFSVKSYANGEPGVKNLNSILSKPVNGYWLMILFASANTTLPDKVLLKILSYIFTSNI